VCIIYKKDKEILMPENPDNLIWIDLEMTGLNPFEDRIIEIATIVTDKHLEEIVVGPVLAIHQEASILDGMDEWNTKQHAKTGLTKRVKNSTVTERGAEKATLEFLGHFVPPKTSPMCGNSICQDRRFMARLMPELESYFHYRNLDVSTLKELAHRWQPEMANGYAKESKHLALDDIRDSIEELKFYREHFLKRPQ